MQFLGDYYQVTPGWAEARTAWWNYASAGWKRLLMSRQQLMSSLEQQTQQQVTKQFV